MKQSVTVKYAIFKYIYILIPSVEFTLVLESLQDLWNLKPLIFQVFQDDFGVQKQPVCNLTA